MSAKNRPSLGNSVTNWREYDGSFGEKLRLLVRNNWKKLRTRRNCCGHDGEPGC